MGPKGVVAFLLSLAASTAGCGLDIAGKLAPVDASGEPDAPEASELAVDDARGEQDGTAEHEDAVDLHDPAEPSGEEGPDDAGGEAETDLPGGDDDPPPPDETDGGLDADLVEAEVAPETPETPEAGETGCPGDCSGHGDCVEATCVCATGYAGPGCGRCDSGFTGYPACVHCGSAGEGCCEAGTCNGGLSCFAGVCRPACPDGMTRVSPAVCIDSYEASSGAAGAQSVAGVRPWVNINRNEAGAACVAAGKRLCANGEWQLACSGGVGLAFPYGATFSAGTCNDINPGYCKKDGTGVAATEAHSSCEGGFAGIYDMSGNVWEWVEDGDATTAMLFGGSVDGCQDPLLLSCTTGASRERTLRYKAIGFRCCKGW